MDFTAFPKVELHLHLDCSLSFRVVSMLRPSASYAEFGRDFIAPAKCTDLADYISRAEHGVALMQSEKALALVVDDLFNQLVEDNVVYAEIRFAPLLHTRCGLKGHEVVEIVADAVLASSERTGVAARLILCTLRHYTRVQSMETVRLVDRFRGSCVAGFDIAGDEAGFPIDAHCEAFEHARQHRIPCTAHAGEARGAESVWETLRHFQPARIGHGVRSIEDASLLEHLRQTKIHLEVCPTSNVQTAVVENHHDHYIDRLFQAGVSVGVNTDARTISNVTLKSEYDLLHDVFGWSVPHFRQCNLNAMAAAFVTDALKQSLGSRLIAEYDRLQ